MAKIVVVEDDIMLQEELVDILEKEGYEAIPITNFNANVSAQINTLAPDLVLLDINLPQQSGFEICRNLKGKSRVLVLVLTSRDRLSDELHALDLGADDYLNKPFHKEKLLARIKNLLRRFEGSPKLMDGGVFQIDPQTYTLYVAEQAIVLPTNEGKILTALLEHSPEVVTKEQLSNYLWGTTAYIDENALQVNIGRLRKNLRQFELDDLMETVRGQGYRLKGKE